MKHRNQTMVACSVLMCAFIILLWGFGSPAFAVKKGGILRVGIGHDPNLLDPPNMADDPSFPMSSNIFEQLLNFSYDEKTKKVTTVPRLAVKWEQSKDGKSWTFYLRKGVKFHDGSAFNAEALKFNFDRLVNEVTKYGTDVKAVIDRTEVVDEYTAKVYLKTPSVLFLNVLDTPYAGIVSPTAIKKYGDKVGHHPTGTGPFKFEKWASGEYVELKAYEEYWGGRPNLDGMIFRFTPDDSARISMLESGELDIIVAVPIPEFERMKKAGRLDVQSWKTSLVSRVWIHCNVPPYNDVKMRQAIKLAIDRKSIVEDILKGNGYAVESAASPVSWGYYPADPPTYDPEKAKKLFTEAGWVDKDGDGIREKGDQKLIFTLYTTPPGRGVMRREIALAIQEYLRHVGVDCKLLFEGFPVMLDRGLTTADKAKEGAFLLNWSSKTDAWFILYTWFYSGKWYPDKPHWMFYRNTDFDKLLDQAQGELDNEKRFELYKQAQIIMANDTPEIAISVDYNTLAKHKYVQGVRCDPIPSQDAFLNVRGAWLDK